MLECDFGILRKGMVMKEENKVIRFSVSLPKNLLDNLDARLTNQGYASRSELVRDLIREKMIEEQWEQGNENQAAVLVMIYDHHTRELNQRMIDIQHDTTEVEVLCTTHVHLDHHNCLETIVFKGSASAIYRISIEIGGLRGVKFSKLTKVINFSQEF